MIGSVPSMNTLDIRFSSRSVFLSESSKPSSPWGLCVPAESAKRVDPIGLIATSFGSFTK